jgi:hypothetical protein
VKVAAGVVEYLGFYRSTMSEHKHTSDHTGHNKDTNLLGCYYCPTCCLNPLRHTGNYSATYRTVTLRNPAHCTDNIFIDFCLILRKNYFSKSHICVKETSYIFWETGTHFSNLHCIKFMLKSVKTCLFSLKLLLAHT